jgi:hypothetical protein
MWVGNIETVMTDWHGLVWGRVLWKTFLNTVMNHGVQLNDGKFFSSCTAGDILRSAQRRGVSLAVSTASIYNYSEYL